ncbi:MAG: sigma-70 family RNA polymerase sigma factor [Clostridia bacterium]|nr:sigma-70 family RNA polymerase sigma factor [Clostridia bacterium]
MTDMDQIYREHAQTVYKYLLLHLTDKDEKSVAEDLTQETFLRALKAIDTFDGSCKITTWLCGIANNVLSEYRKRKQKYPPAQPQEWDLPVGSTEGDVIARLGRMDLIRRIHELGSETCEIMLLRLFGDCSFKEIAEILRISENKARVVFYRGKEKLRKEWKDNEE